MRVAVAAEDVSLQLSPGSVIVDATITLPGGASPQSAQSALSSSPSLAEEVVVAIASVPSIMAVCTGDITVEDISVALQTTLTSTTSTTRPRRAGTRAATVWRHGRPTAMLLFLPLSAVAL